MRRNSCGDSNFATVFADNKVNARRRQMLICMAKVSMISSWLKQPLINRVEFSHPFHCNDIYLEVIARSWMQGHSVDFPSLPDELNYFESLMLRVVTQF